MFSSQKQQEFKSLFSYLKINLRVCAQRRNSNQSEDPIFNNLFNMFFESNNSERRNTNRNLNTNRSNPRPQRVIFVLFFFLKLKKNFIAIIKLWAIKDFF